MLRELSVQNLALIEDVRIELSSGFCALTGETGAGKSLLLGALGLLLGERGSVDLLRGGAEELRITGRFELDKQTSRAEVERILDSPLEDSEIILSRRLNRAGRSHAYVNDQPVAVSTLKQIGTQLVDLHGQRETESLLEPVAQLQVLDEFGNLHKYRAAYQSAAEKLKDARRRYLNLSAQRQERQRELTLFLRFERDELDRANLEPGESAELGRQRERLANAQQLQSFALGSYATLYEDEGSVIERLGRVKREAEGWAEVDPELAEVVNRLDNLTSDVKEVAQIIRRLGQRWEADPERQAEVEARLQFLRKLEAKYRKSVDELIIYRVGLDEQEAKLQQAEDDQGRGEEELAGLFGQLKESAQELSKQRTRVARKLAAETQKQLAELGMKEARLGAELTPIALGQDPVTTVIPACGADGLELTLAANPGEPALPLRKVASGGELSRTMLALKTVLAGHDHTSTLVFDEIDANVGGRLGDVLGQKLAALGQTHQVICVTHLPQVASYARHHWSIRKTRRGGRTVTLIQALAEPDRLEELASMLRGEARSDTTRQEVAAMLDAARRCW